MFNSYGGASLSDIAALMGNRNGMGMDGGGWWAWIILLVLFGDNGFGFGSGNRNNTNSVPATAGDLQRGFDTQTVVNKLNGLENGLCSLGYDQLGQMNGIQQSIAQLGFMLQNTAQQNEMANMQRSFAAQQQASDCCCENRAAIAQVRYDMSTDTCAITTAIKDAAQSIMLNDNNNYRQLHDEMIAMQMAAKDETIASLRSKLDRCDSRADLAETAMQIQNYIRPQVNPAFIVPNPYAWNNGNCCNNNQCCNNY